MGAGIDAGEHAVRHEVIEPRAQDVLRNSPLMLTLVFLRFIATSACCSSLASRHATARPQPSRLP
jgi:hypothetical protein